MLSTQPKRKGAAASKVERAKVKRMKLAAVASVKEQKVKHATEAEQKRVERIADHYIHADARAIVAAAGDRVIWGKGDANLLMVKAVNRA